MNLSDLNDLSGVRVSRKKVKGSGKKGKKGYRMEVDTHRRVVDPVTGMVT